MKTLTTLTAITLLCLTIPAESTEQANFQPNTSESTITEQKVSSEVPEPSSIVALAFAGVVILARHRFRPS